MTFVKTDPKTGKELNTESAGPLQGESAQTASPLTAKNRAELVEFASSRIDRYRHHINREIFDDVMEAMLDLYGGIVKKDGNDVLVFYRHQVLQDRQTTMMEVNLAGPLKQYTHLSVFSDYGADLVELQDQISTVNDEMIHDFALSLQTTPTIEKKLSHFILRILELLPDYVPYHYTTIEDFAIDERLIFVNYMTSHSVMISICPFRMAWKNANQEACDNHTCQTPLQ